MREKIVAHQNTPDASLSQKSVPLDRKSSAPIKPRFHPKTSLHLIIWIVMTVFLGVLEPARSLPNQALASIALVVFGAALYSLSRVMPTGNWSPAGMFLIVVGVFHIGLAPFWILSIDPELTLRTDVWFHDERGGSAIHLTTLAIASYTVGTLLSVMNKRGRASVHAKNALGRSFAHSRNAKLFSRCGAIILIGAVFFWFILSARAGGISILWSSYSQFLNVTSNTSLSYAYFALGIGFGLTLIRPVDNYVARIAILCFGSYVAFAFFLGLRGEVLFPLVVGLSVMGFRRKLPNLVYTSLIAILLLTLINAAKQVRQQGVAESTFSWHEASPLAALGELGSSIRVVATIVDWHQIMGEPLRFGDTYTVSLARQWEAIADPSGKLPASDDFRLFNVEIYERVGGIGGSVIAEAYHNFAIMGVVFVMIVLGLIFGRFSVGYPTPSRLALYVIIAIPLFNHIRNSFVPVIPMVLIGLLILFAMKLLSKVAVRSYYRNTLRRRMGKAVNHGKAIR